MQHDFKVVSKDDKTGSVEVFTFNHTHHSLIRSAQRGINDRKLAIAILYGEPFYKQGLIYYVLGEDRIPEILSKEKEKLRNTVVVVDGDSDTVITCYRSKDPYKHIRVKSKSLFINRIAA
ncbi:MAG: hypothetical protein CFE25_05640 [Chitinophagaceae bacterium BSSC1]|nr:MAG: hypothetical protein CFE25_05640 [Chitinophagaceae bacterium BSSC1]